MTYSIVQSTAGEWTEEWGSRLVSYQTQCCPEGRECGFSMLMVMNIQEWFLQPSPSTNALVVVQ